METEEKNQNQGGQSQSKEQSKEQTILKERTQEPKIRINPELRPKEPKIRIIPEGQEPPKGKPLND